MQMPSGWAAYPDAVRRLRRLFVWSSVIAAVAAWREKKLRQNERRFGRR